MECTEIFRNQLKMLSVEGLARWMGYISELKYERCGCRAKLRFELTLQRVDVAKLHFFVYRHREHKETFERFKNQCRSLK